LPRVAVAPKSQPRKRSLNHTGATSLLASQQQRATAVYNLATAAAAAGINKSTVLRHIKAGKVSATRDHNGGWQIDPAEFHRTFPPLVQPPKQQDATADAMVALLREQLADMRQQRDHWQIEAADWKRQAQNLLPADLPDPGDPNEHFRGRKKSEDPDSGFIGLQVHTGNVAFANIRIKT
jgi:hypothetical protein